MPPALMKFLQGPKDNLVDELFTPNFNKCKLYRRQTAFFQPSVFKSWGNSIKSIVDNETKLEILMAVSETNFKILNTINNLQTKEEKNKLLAKEANGFFEQCLGLSGATGDYQNRKRLIRYLYAKGQLEIKLCISCDENQENLSLSHNKLGYFLNESDGYISFSGSANESDSALMRHGEDLLVFDSKEAQDYESAKELKDALDKKWNESDPHNIVFKPTKEFIGKIKKISDIKDKKEALEITKEILEEMGVISHEEIELRDHQIKAIKAWDANGKRGILAHATGSGKTITALATIRSLRKSITNGSLVVLVGVPFIPLADQWLDQVDDFFGKDKKKEKYIFNGTIGCYSGQSNWNLEAEKELLLFQESLSRGEAHLSIIVVVNKTLSDNEEFNFLFNKTKINPDRLLIIGDECHRYALEKPRKALPEAKYKMGLSATPFNDVVKTEQEGEMDVFFGGVCDEYSLKDGIRDKHLCKYYYYPKECFLDEEEFFNWKEYLDKGDLNDEHLKDMEKIIDNS
ncbi:MAG: hypothetical protein CMC52_03025, partial [Flavobacteriaceae bacterium]|nr:hypothetical protein [Flavobacteriaceae bacterium]